MDATEAESAIISEDALTGLQIERNIWVVQMRFCFICFYEADEVLSYSVALFVEVKTKEVSNARSGIVTVEGVGYISRG